MLYKTVWLKPLVIGAEHLTILTVHQYAKQFKCTHTNKLLSYLNNLNYGVQKWSGTCFMLDLYDK